MIMMTHSSTIFVLCLGKGTSPSPILHVRRAEVPLPSVLLKFYYQLNYLNIIYYWGNCFSVINKFLMKWFISLFIFHAWMPHFSACTSDWNHGKGELCFDMYTSHSCVRKVCCVKDPASLLGFWNLWDGKHNSLWPKLASSFGIFFLTLIQFH